MSNNFTSTVTQLLRDNIINSQQFWPELENTSRNAYYYALKLFDILSSQNKRQKYIHFVERISSMVLILEYFLDVDKKDSKLLDDCRESVRKIEQKISLAERWIFQLFLQNANQEVFVEGFIRVLSTIPIPRWLTPNEKQKQLQKQKQKQKNKSKLGGQKQQQNIPLKELKRVAEVQKQKRLQKLPYYYAIKGVETFRPNSQFTFGYICFQDYIEAKDLKLSEKIYRDIIKALQQILELSTHADIMSNIALMLHFIQTLLKFYVLPYREIIKELLIIIRQFRNFPIPVGVLAQQIVEMLYDQIKVLGFTYRHNIRSNIPALDIVSAQNIDYTAYFVGISEDFLTTTPFCSIDALRKTLILNMLAKIKIPQNKQQQLLNNICYMPLQTAFQYYYKLLKISQVCMQASTIQQTMKIQQKAIGNLLNQIQKQPLQTSSYVYSQMQQIYKNKQYSFFQYPQCQIKFIHLRQFTDSNSKAYNFKIILENHLNEYRLHQQKLRIVFRGTDKQFRSIVQMIGEKYQKNESIQALKTMELFILPEKREQSLLAAYIAKNDGWYSQFIYSAFCSQYFYPECNHLSLKILPGILLQKTVQTYIRQASRNLNLVLFKACIDYGGSKKPDTVYFCRSVQLGLSALIHKTRYSKQKYNDMDYLQLFLQKIKDQQKFNEQLNVEMNVGICDVCGDQVKDQSFQQMKIADLRVCNVPIEYFFGKQPAPYTNSLELCFLKSQYAKQYQKLLRQKSLFKKSQQQIVFAFRSLFCCQSIKNIFISSKKPMTACIDGQFFNNINSISIESLKNSKENKLPIKTFLPFKLN